MIRKLKQQAREARLKLAGHSPVKIAQGETAMYYPKDDLHIPEELQKHWHTARARAGTKVIKDPKYRFGMIIKVDKARRDGVRYCWRCLACRDDFPSHRDACTHRCMFEAAYREYTGRTAPAKWDYATTSFRRGRKPGGKNRPKVTPMYSVSLPQMTVTQPTPAPAPVPEPEPVPAGVPTVLTLEPEAFVRWMHATLAERDAAIAERDKAVAALDFSVIRQEEVAKELRLKTHDLVLAQNENQRLRAVHSEPITTALSMENQQVYGEYQKKVQ